MGMALVVFSGFLIVYVYLIHRNLEERNSFLEASLRENMMRRVVEGVVCENLMGHWN